MGLFDKIKDPVFLKEKSSVKEQIEKLELMKHDANLTSDSKRQIEKDIKILMMGLTGEDNIAFELKNSHIPMFVLHDLHIEFQGLSAQIDYLIITRKRLFVVECKNLVGDIEIDAGGNFIRTIHNGSQVIKEGIYSPITQNTRHLELLKQVRAEEKANIISKILFERYFYENYRSVVVLSNPKTVLNARYAKKEVKNQVIRADQLVHFIKTVNSQSGVEPRSEKSMEELARFYLSLHKESEKDYTEKYLEVSRNNTPQAKTEIIACPLCNAPMVKRKASKGNNIGKEFWGCSQFPKCKGIINIL